MKLHKNKFDFSNHTAVKMGGGVPAEEGDQDRRPGLLYSHGAYGSHILKKVLGREICNVLVKM